MNKSFLLTSNKRFDRNSYLIPNSMEFAGIRLKSAIINFSEENVVGHVAYRSFSSESETEPAPNIKVPYTVPDGSYTPDEYATALTKALNKEDNQGEFTVTYNQSSGKMDIFYTALGYDNAVYLTFNEQASDYLGTNFGEWMRWTRFGSEKTLTTPRKVLALPRYYRVCSNKLAQFGMAYDNSMGSNILGIIPVDYSKKWTSWENSDDFFHFRTNNDCRLNTLLDIEIFAEESIAPIKDPDFVLVFQIQA